MTHIAGITLRNWRRFRGEHSIRLGEGVYSLVARWEGEEGRSNWGGKTAFLEAIAFAAVGWVPRGDVLDDCVTHGAEEEGALVRLELAEGGQECGAITRTIKGGSSELVVELSEALGSTVPSTPRLARGGAAQELLDEFFVGFDAEDFMAGPFGRQKELDALVQATPAALMAKIGAWLELDQLREAVKDCRADAAGRRKARDGLNGQLEEARRLLDQVPEGGELLLPVAEGALKDAEVAYKAADAEHGELLRVLAEARAAEGRERRLRAELERVVEDGKAARAELDLAGDAPTEAAVAELEAAAGVAREQAGGAAERLRQAERGARGRFDGLCPVAGIACPATDQINAGCAEAEAARDRAHALAKSLGAAWSEAAARHKEAAQERARVAALGARVEALRTRYGTLETALEEGPGGLDAPDPAEVETVRQRRAEADEARRRAYQQLADLRGAVEQRKRSEERIARLVEDVEVETQAMLLAGRAATIFAEAQRVVAEGSLGEIEALANRGLAGAGIPLSVEIRWRRKARGPADECATCGQAFPRSRKVKECGVCGAARGEKVDEYPEIRPSSSSGAADDMAGALAQMAAGAFLRGQRGAPWSTAILDEPTSAADPSNCRAFALALRRLLCGPEFGYSQAIVSSHDQATQEAFEHRIVVVAGPDSSRLEVS